MSHPAELPIVDIDAYLHERDRNTLLRFITCGSVDDGKSTLIGRLLYESQALFEDQLATLQRDSRRFGTQGEALDFALLLDGLSAEREQGITIDVAYRYFSSGRRNFIVADTPGHEQYTRNMVTGASTADVAVILVDARKGLLVQTRRHSHLVALLGVRKVVLAVNKLDLVQFSQQVFERIAADYTAFARQIGLSEIECIPLAALHGDNVTVPSERTPWYHGPTLMGYLNTVDPAPTATASEGPLRMLVQAVIRPNLDFRGYCVRIVGGKVRPGARIRVLPSGKQATVARIFIGARELDQAHDGQCVTLTLDEEIDITRGDVIAAAEAPPAIADQFEASIVWMADEAMLPGRPYLMKIGTRTVSATLATPKYRLNVNTLEHVAARTLQLNEIGVGNLSLDRAVPFDRYADNRDTGSFILIDRFTHHTVGAGMLHFALRRSQNIHWQALEIDRHARAALNGHRPCAVWFTGLSGAGKSTIANVLEKKLHALGRHTYLLDGDNVRHGLNRDLGFTEADRVENIRRVAEVTRLMVDAGLVVLVSFISPFRAERAFARSLLAPGEFVEVFVDTPLAVAEQRDRKGLYAKARRGELANFTGIDSPYEAPIEAEIRIDTTAMDAEHAAELIIARLEAIGSL